MHLLDLKKVGATDAILESAEVMNALYMFLFVNSDHAYICFCRQAYSLALNF